MHAFIAYQIYALQPFPISLYSFNLSAGYFQNVRIYKDKEAKFRSIMTGDALGKVQSTFDLCSEFAKMGVNALS